MRTIVTNISGDDRYFGYLPPHGRAIADGDSVVLDGDLRSVLASGRDRYSRATELASLDSDVADGVVEVTHEADSSST